MISRYSSSDGLLDVVVSTQYGFARNARRTAAVSVSPPANRVNVQPASCEILVVPVPSSHATEIVPLPATLPPGDGVVNWTSAAAR